MYSAQKAKDLERLKFRAADHRYTLDGMVIPSVTQVIAPFEPYFWMPEEMLEAARERGNLVHSITAAIDRNPSSLSDYLDIADDLNLRGYIDGYLAFKQHGVVCYAVERRVFHKRLRFSGTLDRVVRIGNGPLGILDIKTGKHVAAYKMQTAAYKEAYNEGNSNKTDLRYVLQLNENGTFVLHEHTDKEDFDAFKAALVLHQWRIKNHD